MKLKTGDVEVRYSPAERDLFLLIPQSAKNSVTSTTLVEKRYGAKAPYHALSIIRAVISSLNKKMEANGEPFRIKKTARAGPHPTSYWVEKKFKDERNLAQRLLED